MLCHVRNGRLYLWRRSATVALRERPVGHGAFVRVPVHRYLTLDTREQSELETRAERAGERPAPPTCNKYVRRGAVTLGNWHCLRRLPLV